MLKSLALLSSFAIALNSFASDDAAVKKLIEGKTKQFITAMKAKDISWFENNSTSDYTESMDSRTYTKAVSMSKMKQLFTMSKSMPTVTSKVVSFKMNGKNAIVVTKTHFVATLSGPQGKPMAIEDSAVEEETWVPAGKDYKLKLLKGLSDKMMLNGKPFKAAM